MAYFLPQAVFMVDGYNIIGSWTSLKKTRDRMGLEAARWKLIQSLIDYSAFQGYKTQLVFDAQYRNCPGNCEVITQNLAVYYTDFGQTADTYIEKVCALSRQNVPRLQQRVIVVTSDRAQQLTVMGYGAEWMSAQQLAGEVKAVNALVHQKQKSNKKLPTRFLANSLDPLAKKRLERLRMGID
jgi:predicted RNA-binding protein with PIN domain